MISQGDANHYLAKICRKLHENENNWTERGWGGVEGALSEFYYVHPPILSSFISHLEVVGILLIQTACAIGS